MKSFRIKEKSVFNCERVLLLYSSFLEDAIKEKVIDTYRIRVIIRAYGGNEMKDNYTYPAIISENEVGGMDIIFPDFDNATTCVAKGEDAVEAAQDFLVLMIADAEDSGRELPQPGKRKYVVENGLSLVYINVWMPYHRTKIKEVYVKKTLTIPVWLDMLAKENNINFSATLVKGLKEELGLNT